MNRVINQKHYPTLCVDMDENDIVQITQNGKEDFNMIMVEKENWQRLFELGNPESSERIKELKNALMSIKKNCTDNSTPIDTIIIVIESICNEALKP